MVLSKHIADALTRAGGKTPSGLPIYKFAWSADDEACYLISNGKGYEKFRIVATDCWLVMKWEPPEFWGTEADWISTNYEPLNDLYTAGPYPAQGRYRVINKLIAHVVEGDRLIAKPFQPTMQFVEETFPLLKAFQDLPYDQRAAWLTNREKAQKEKLLKELVETRKLYKGTATAAQVKAKEEALERFLLNPENRAMIDSLRSTNA